MQATKLARRASHEPVKFQKNLDAVVDTYIQTYAPKSRSGRAPTKEQVKFAMASPISKGLLPVADFNLVVYDNNKTGGCDASAITKWEVIAARAYTSGRITHAVAGLIVSKPGGSLEKVNGETAYGGIIYGAWARARMTNGDLVEKDYARGELTPAFPSEMWQRMEGRMLCKNALVRLLRELAPDTVGGLYVEEELPPIDVTPKPATELQAPPPLSTPSLPSGSSTIQTGNGANGNGAELKAEAAKLWDALKDKAADTLPNSNEIGLLVTWKGAKDAKTKKAKDEAFIFCPSEIARLFSIADRNPKALFVVKKILDLVRDKYQGVPADEPLDLANIPEVSEEDGALT
jgi:hypothetical protein